MYFSLMYKDPLENDNNCVLRHSLIRTKMAAVYLQYGVLS